ncbi:ATP-binding protein [Pseudoalteromonas sp. T1lg65]|uniref:ATP-binding protein n=1 Tax=Pseudoalteromonas sp. T1lg65 TaxID=2077101 RepID=UPI003F7A898E
MLAQYSASPRKLRSVKAGFWLMLSVMAVIAWHVDNVNYQRLVEIERSRVVEEANVYRTKIEGVLAKNVQLVRGLSVVLANSTDLSQEKFATLAQPLYASSKIVRNLGAAPDMTLSYIYPLKGNEQALGLNYLTHPEQKFAAVQARDSGEIVMSGPLELVQGGMALIARVPVIQQDSRAFWGLLSVVIDVDALFEQAELHQLEESYYVSLRKVDNDGIEGDYFYGSKQIDKYSPISFSVSFPQGEWKLYVAPRFGWQPMTSALWPFRLSMLVLIMIFIGAFFFISRLLDQIREQTEALTNMGILAKVGAWELDIANREIHWSEVTKSIFQVPADFTLTWSNAIEFFQLGDSKKRVQELLDKLIRTGQEFEAEFQVTTYTGNNLWLLIKARANHRAGRTSKVYGSVQDIQARKQMEIEHRKVAKNNELLAQLSANESILNNHLNKAMILCADTCRAGVAANKVSIWQMNQEQTILTPRCFTNSNIDNLQHFPSWRKSSHPSLFRDITSNHLILADVASQHPALQNLQEPYLDPFDIKAMLCAPILYKNTVLGMLSVEYSQTKPEWTQGDIRLIKSIAAILGSLFDSNARRQEKNQALIAKDLAEQSAKMKAEFLASMSHEIRTPLNGVLGMIDIVMQSKLNATQKHQLSLAQSSANSLLTTINDILDFSKIEAGKLQVEQVEFDLIQILSNTIAEFSQAAYKNHNQLRIDLSAMTIQKASGDPHRLKQILNNLLSNAIKFTQNGDICLTCHTETINHKTKLWCSVEDTGTGISKQKLSKIFDSFTQADLSTTRQYGGTGLGLSIAKQLCNLMDGDIQAFSKENMGSNFTFHITLAAPIAIKPLYPNQNPVLIIFSEQASCIDEHFLRPWSINCHSANTYQKLVDLLADSPISPTIVLLDTDSILKLSGSQQQHLKGQFTRHHIPFGLLSHSHTVLTETIFSETIQLFYPLTPFTALKLFQQYDNAEASAAQSTEQRLELTSQLQVLLVEDNKINQTVALTLLKRLGIEAKCVENGEQAITWLKQQPTCYDIILMDCQMPIMDGYQATQQIRQGQAGKQHQQSHIIALTANAMQGDREKCLAAGMNDYLSKPIDFELMKEKLLAVCQDTLDMAQNQ